MNKKVLFGVFGLAGSLFAAEPAVVSFNPYVAVKGGLTICPKADKIKYKKGFVGAVEMGVSYDAWRLGLEVSYRQNKVKSSENANVTYQYQEAEKAKLNVLAGMVNAYYDYALTDECSLYLGVGLGVAKVAMNRLDVRNYRFENSRTAFAWQVMAGVSYDIDENWTVEAGYRLFNTMKVKLDGEHKVKTPFANSLELGIRYNF